MSIKSQDIVVLAKLIANFSDPHWSQNGIAVDLCLSPSQINSAIKRLLYAGLLTSYKPPQKPQPILDACNEFFTYGIKYIFPAKLGAITRGVRTSYAGPSFENEISLGSEAFPVWSYGEGQDRGAALKPLYHTVPESVIKHPDPIFYDILTLIDAIRSGRARERQIATHKLSTILKSKISKN
jgi:hypothetical protein